MSKLTDELEARVYKELCSSCPHSKKCHDECTTCEDFQKTLESYVRSQSHLTKKQLESVYLNKKVHVIIRDPFHPIDADGIVTSVDDACQLHGTWGSLAAILPYDWVNLVTSKNGWQVSIDLTGDDQEENISILSSPIFSTEEQADNWYRSLEIDSSDLQRINKGLDIIMIHWVDGRIDNTYII